MEFVKKAVEICPTVGSSRIYIGDHLLRETAELLKLAKQKKKAEGEFKFVWIKNGDVYARTDKNSPAIKVRNVENLTCSKENGSQLESESGKETHRGKHTIEDRSPNQQRNHFTSSKKRTSIDNQRSNA